MRLLQLHEYYELVAEEGRSVPVPEELRAPWLEQARRIWPDTGLELWEARPRDVVACHRDSQGRILAYVNADHEDCYLILAGASAQAAPKAYLLFDVGVEYKQAVYVCPSANYDGPADDEIIDASIAHLNGHRDPFAVVYVSEGTYMQAYQDESGQYELDHQLVTTASHYRAEGTLNAVVVAAALKSYARGDSDWTTAVHWRRIELLAG